MGGVYIEIVQGGDDFMRDSDYELEQLFSHFEKLVEKERRRRIKKNSVEQEKAEKGKKDEGRYIKHDRD